MTTMRVPRSPRGQAAQTARRVKNMLRAVNQQGLVGMFGDRRQSLHPQQPRPEHRAQRFEEARQRGRAERSRLREGVGADRTRVDARVRAARARGKVERLGEEVLEAEFAGRRVEDRRDGIDARDRRAQPREARGAVRRFEKIALRQRDPVGQRDLAPRFAMRFERRLAVDGVDERRDARKDRPPRQDRIGHQRVQNRRGVGEAARLQDDPGKASERARVAAGQQVAQAVDEIAAQRAAQAARRHEDHVALDRLEQQMVEPDLSPFVDDDERVGEFARAQQAVDQRGLAGAEKARHDMQRNCLGLAHGSAGAVSARLEALVAGCIALVVSCAVISAAKLERGAGRGASLARVLHACLTLRYPPANHAGPLAS